MVFGFLNLSIMWMCRDTGIGTLHMICCLCSREAADGPLKGILGYTNDDVVSQDFVHDSRWVCSSTPGPWLKDAYNGRDSVDCWKYTPPRDSILAMPTLICVYCCDVTDLINWTYGRELRHLARSYFSAASSVLHASLLFVYVLILRCRLSDQASLTSRRALHWTRALWNSLVGTTMNGATPTVSLTLLLTSPRSSRVVKSCLYGTSRMCRISYSFTSKQKRFFSLTTCSQ